MQKFHDNHILFSAENPQHEGKYPNKPSHEEVLDFLRSNGEDAVAVDGHYGAPERSILVNSPKNPHGIHQLAEDIGQDSILHSNGGKHTLHYLNGPQKGKQIHGQGTVFHTNKPADMYTTMKSPEGEVHFSHNLDFGKSEGLAKMPKVFSAKEGKPSTTVYRMQNAAGEGPYDAADVPSLDDHGGEHNPSPTDDRGFNNRDLGVLQSNPTVKFGFHKPEQANSWFKPEEIEDLKNQGFNLEPVQAEHVWSSGKQAFFKKFVAPKRTK